MNTVRLSNIPLNDFREFLLDRGCYRVCNGTKGRGGHELWTKPGLKRPITLQSHIDPVAEKAVRSNLNTLGVSRKEFETWFLEKRKRLHK